VPLPLPADVRVDVHVTPDDLAAALRADALAGLTATPKSIPPTWFYDARGSELYEEITRLPEYYPFRRERDLLIAVAAEVAEASGADTVLELGSGSSEKTRLLLDALRDAGTLRRYVPVDVSETALRSAASALVQEYPGLEVHGVVADLRRHLDRLPGRGRRLVAFLGSTIGNSRPEERAALLGRLAEGMGPGDALLLGTDLVKDPDRLVAAYDDAAGVTAEFNRNVLRVLDRELDGDLDAESFDHVARWNPDEQWVEMRLRSRTGHTARLAALDLKVSFAAGEEMLTEVSAKFTCQRVERELVAAGLTLRRWWTDPDGDYALSLSVRA
jgi:L-histidine N-alpha-methyltransferase